MNIKKANVEAKKKAFIEILEYVGDRTCDIVRYLTELQKSTKTTKAKERIESNLELSLEDFQKRFNEILYQTYGNKNIFQEILFQEFESIERVKYGLVFSVLLQEFVVPENLYIDPNGKNWINKGWLFWGLCYHEATSKKGVDYTTETYVDLIEEKSAPHDTNVSFADYIRLCYPKAKKSFAL